MPIDENHFFVVIAKNGNAEEISSILKMKDADWYDWEDAIKKARQRENFDQNGFYEIAIVSNQISGWNYIFCKKIKDLKYNLNLCHDLSKIYEDIFSFSIDVHSGDYRFIKVQNRRILRFFERDCNQVTGEFGEQLEEETAIEEENEEHDYFYANQVAEKIIRLDLINESQRKNEKVLVGKRYYREIEKYKNLYIEPAKPSDSTRGEVNGEDLPF